MSELLYLLYRKLRPAFGIPFAFVLMSGAFLGGIDFQLIMAAFGFLFIDLFGNFYNDYWDFAEDVRNGRKDKFTTRGFISAKSALYVSIVFAALGLVIFLFSNRLLMSVGVLYLILLLGYSHKSIRLKGRLAGYSIISSPFFILPLAVAGANRLPVMDALPLASFFFFQCMYIVCQKDSTDMNDKSNMFTVYGWKIASGMTAFFAALASMSLLLLLAGSAMLALFWTANLFSKFLNVSKIIKNTIVRSERSRLVLAEFLTHYLFVGGVFL